MRPSVLRPTPTIRLACVAIAFAAASATVSAQTHEFGKVDFPTSAAPAAQQHFLRGLALLHDFEYATAAAAFKEAQRIDPGFAIAYWGEAMTYNHPVWFQQDSAAARAALARLGATPEARAARAPTAREKDYLSAVEVLFGTGDKKSRDFAYRDAMQRLMQRYPEDEDAALFYALALLGSAHNGRDVGIYMRAAAVAEEVFRKHPQHPGAAHYLIHSYDDPQHAPLGLPAARSYSQIAPGAGHAQHMTSHIFVALGMWEDVVRANENAMKVVNAQRHHDGHGPAGCGHYNYWLEYAYLMQGRTADARKLLDACRATVAAGEAPPGGYVTMRARMLLDTEDWSSELAREAVTARMLPQMAHANAFVDAFAAARRGDRARADEQLAKMRALRATIPTAGGQGLYASDVAIAGVLEQQIESLLLIADGKVGDALRLARAAADQEASIPYEFGPPFVLKPSHELLGELLLQAGQPAEAVAAFEQALARAPLRANALDGLIRAAEQAGDSAKAEQARKERAGIRR